jgi:uncharacterized membrane protein YjjP (DUF1212 family)
MPASLTRPAALDIVAQAATLLFENGETTEETVVAADKLGGALGVPVTLLPYWGELALRVDGTPLSDTVPATPLGVDTVKVLATINIVDQIADGTLPGTAALAALAEVKRLRPASTPRFALFAAIAAASLGVIWGVLGPASLLLMAFSAGAGALLRRQLAALSGNPYIQPLCAAAVAGAVGAIAMRFHLADAQLLIALCPCMILVPGPHLLNGAIDLARARITLGIARLTYSGVILIAICAGLLVGLAAGNATLPAAGSFVPVPPGADVIAAGCAAAGFATFFSVPWRLLPLPIVAGMVARAARWALMSLAGAGAATGALVACALVGIVITPIAHRRSLPLGPLAFSAVVSMMPGLPLFRFASDLVQLVSSRERATPGLLTSIVANSTTAFLIVLAMTIGLIVPRMLFQYFLPLSARDRRTTATFKRGPPRQRKLRSG